MKILGTTKISPATVIEGSTVSILYQGKYAAKEICLKHIVTKEDEMEVDVVKVFSFTDEFGCHCGIGGFFGKEK